MKTLYKLRTRNDFMYRICYNNNNNDYIILYYTLYRYTTCTVYYINNKRVTYYMFFVFAIEDICNSRIVIS